MTRDQLVKSLVSEYRKHGKDAAIKLFDQSIKRFEISQFGIKTIIVEFRQAIAVPCDVPEFKQPGLAPENEGI